jgi:DNA-binding MurR/RpiR family transcriptional regulator
MGLPRSCRLRILSIYDDLKAAERRAVELLLNNADDVPHLTIGEYARRAGCSEATVVRLSKRLGYDGYPQLKHAIADEPEHDAIGDFESVSPSDDPITVVAKVVDSAISGLRDTVEVIDPDAYVRAVDAFVGAEKIVFCGLGDGFPVAIEACQRFDRVGQPSWAPVDADQQLVLASNLGPGNVLVAISHSGRSTTILDAIDAAARSGATIVAITNYPGSPIAREAEIVLQTAVFTTDWSGEIVSKRIAQLAVIESLFANFMIRRGDRAVQALRSINSVVRIHKRYP